MLEGISNNQSRYEIVRPLAEGGFGQVYLARVRGEAGFYRTVAIKRLRPELVSGPDFISDFIKEARIGGYLQHHNVVQVLGFERLAGHYALIMDYVDGVGLERVLQHSREQGAHLPAAVIAEIIAQASDGLHYVHSLRSPEGEELELVHRDLKPSNLLVSRAGLVKISDFGIARAAVSLGQQRTQAGIIKGTVAYFSPEQARGEPMDARSDLYSLGSILYELLALEALFPDREPFAVLGKVGRNDIKGRLDRLPESAAPFLPVLKEILTYDPDARIPTAAALATALRRVQIAHAAAGGSLSSHSALWCEWSALRADTDDPEEDTLVLQAGREDPWLISMKSGGGLTQDGIYAAQPTQRGQLASVAEAPTSQVDRDQTQSYGQALGPGDARPQDGQEAETQPTEHMRTGGAAVGAGATQTLALPTDLGQEGAPLPAPRTNRAIWAAVFFLLAFICGGIYSIYEQRQPAPAPAVARLPDPPKAQPAPKVAPPVVAPAPVAPDPTPTAPPKAAPVAEPRPAPPKAQPKAQPAAPRPTPAAPKATPAAPKATPTPAPVAAPAPAPTPRPAPPPVKVAAAEPGTITISSLPASQVFLDGKSLGETPIRKHSLGAGSHSLRLSRPDLGFAQEVTVTVKAGAEVRVVCHSGGCDVTGS